MKKSKGWLYHVDFPGMATWKNASEKGIYNILDAPHVLEQNRWPRWQCLDCGYIIDGTMEPDSCPGCDVLSSPEALIVEDLKVNLGEPTTMPISLIPKHYDCDCSSCLPWTY
jgi:hypothetical protein